MDSIEVRLAGSATYRPSEIPADLRNAAETLFHPMRAVGYWDERSGDHLCPQARLRRACPHVLPPSDPAHTPYSTTVERDLDAALDVHFPHAAVHVFLS